MSRFLKKSFKHQRYKVVLAATLVLSIFTIFYVLFPETDTTCVAREFLASNTQKYEVSATKVVAQPWRGEHSVYGIFIVPDEYKKTEFFVLAVEGVFCDYRQPFGTLQNIDGISAPPGTHIVRDYMSSRTALWLTLTGRYNLINSPQSWKLIYPVEK